LAANIATGDYDIAQVKSMNIDFSTAMEAYSTPNNCAPTVSKTSRMPSHSLSACRKAH